MRAVSPAGEPVIPTGPLRALGRIFSESYRSSWIPIGKSSRGQMIEPHRVRLLRLLQEADRHAEECRHKLDTTKADSLYETTARP